MRRLAPFVALLSLALTACGGGGDAAAAGVPEPSFAPITAMTNGDPVPDRSLSILGEDGEVATADLVGTPTVINFWATWCAFCVEEMPDIEAAHQALGDAVRFLGVDVQDAPDKAIAFASDTGVTYTSVEDVDRSFFLAMKGRGMPTTVFVDADGIVQYRHTGPLTTDQLLDLAEEHLGVSASSAAA